jgi:hypothetical protein
MDFVAIDFMEPVIKNIEKLKTICADVTHVYYTSYVHSSDLKRLPEKNVPLFKSFLDVMDAMSPKIQRVCIYAGGKV